MIFRFSIGFFTSAIFYTHTRAYLLFGKIYCLENHILHTQTHTHTCTFSDWKLLKNFLQFRPVWDSTPLAQPWPRPAAGLCGFSGKGTPRGMATLRTWPPGATLWMDRLWSHNIYLWTQMFSKSLWFVLRHISVSLQGTYHHLPD